MGGRFFDFEAVRTISSECDAPRRQLSLDVKREEIQKLQDKATQKEEALRRSEQKLEEDAIRFDTFLKENDKRAHDAVKEAEAATKKKNDKVQEIKRLNQQLQAVSSEMSKQREALDDCVKYREFLDGLTPEVHFNENKKLTLHARVADAEISMSSM